MSHRRRAAVSLKAQTTRDADLAPSAERLIGEWVTPSQDGCWLWTGEVHACGYGVHPAIDTYVHRFVYRTLVGPIPPKHHVHHECETKLCVNPAHLKALTPSDHTKHHADRRAS